MRGLARTAVYYGKLQNRFETRAEAKLTKLFWKMGNKIKKKVAVFACLKRDRSWEQ